MPPELKNLNADLYAGDLFDRWAKEQGIIAAERILIERYITHRDRSVLEAGTGGGRIAFYLERSGCTDVHAFDIVPDMIHYARQTAQSTGSKVKFDVADAADLNIYPDQSFDQLVYFQQVLCFIDQPAKFQQALREAYRLMKPGAICIFSFLDYRARSYNPLLSILMRVVRTLRGEQHGAQHLPWLLINGKFNRKFLRRDQPVLYWVKREEIMAMLQEIGFHIIEATSASQLENPSAKQQKGMLYMVCRK